MFLHRRRARRRRRHAVAVVLAHEDDRQLPDRRHVERLVEGALVVGAVAEEGDDDLAGLHALGGQGRADRDRDAAADDAVGAEIAHRDVGDVHRAAAALAVAGRLAEEFGEHPLHVRALGDAVAVAAMRRGDLVLDRQRHADADRARFLADRQMHRAVDQAARVAVLRALLEAADQIHLAQHVLELGCAVLTVGERQVGLRVVGELPGGCHCYAP